MPKLYSTETEKALNNFTASGQPFSLELAKNIALIKKCAAEANIQTKKLSKTTGKAIITAANEVVRGKWDNQIVVDQIQGGAGTSMNMNLNEVIATRAGQLGRKQKVHPIDHVNLSQSTNDVVSTALKITTLQHLDETIEAYTQYYKAFKKKSTEFKNIIKVGRTHIQDAVPMTLGQEFGAHASAIKEDIRRLKQTKNCLYEVNIGGTAIGTGINASKKYADITLKKLKKATNYPLKRAPDLIYATQYVDSFVEVSAILSVLATNIVKCMHDMRILSSGPKTGIGEITFPAVQAGSSIMPGKVNPVMSEYLNQIALQIIGNSNTIALTAQAGQLELNVMMPTLSQNLFESLSWLANGVTQFTNKALKGIKANPERCKELYEQSYAVLTALTPTIGYDKATEIAKKASRSNKSLKEIVLEEAEISEKEYDKLINSKKILTLS